MSSINLQTPIKYPSVVFFSICIVTIIQLGVNHVHERLLFDLSQSQGQISWDIGMRSALTADQLMILISLSLITKGAQWTVLYFKYQTVKCWHVIKMIPITLLYFANKTLRKIAWCCCFFFFQTQSCCQGELEQAVWTDTHTNKQTDWQCIYYSNSTWTLGNTIECFQYHQTVKQFFLLWNISFQHKYKKCSFNIYMSLLYFCHCITIM